MVAIGRNDIPDGVLDNMDEAAIVLPPEELSEYRFVDPGDLEHYFPERIARRLVAGLAARDQGSPRYLVDGRNTDAS